MKLNHDLYKIIFLYLKILIYYYIKLDMINEETISINQRKLEALCGFYSHKDIPFFIQQVLTYLETPIQKKNLKSKEIIEKNSQKKEENNYKSSVSFPLHPLNQTYKFSFPSSTTSNTQNNGFQFNTSADVSNTLNQNSTNNFSFPTSNNTVNQLNSSSSISNFSQQQSNYTLPCQSIQNILKESSSDDLEKKEYSENNYDVFTIIDKFHQDHQDHPFINISFYSQDITNNEESNFLCHIAQHEQTKYYLFASRQLLNKQENKIYEYLLPDNYSWISSYKCFEETIFHIPLMHLFLTINNENNNQNFENIHYLLCAFEDLLKHVLLPMLKHKELSERIHPKIKEAITFSVAIAFDNELKESEYSFKNLLTKQKPKDIDIQWLKEGIHFNKDILRNYQLLPEQELESWIYSTEFKKSEYIYYTQFD